MKKISKEDISIIRRTLSIKIGSLKSPIKDRLLDFLKSGNFAKMSSFIDSIPSSDPSIQLAKDIKTWLEIRKISRQLKKMKIQGEIE